MDRRPAAPMPVRGRLFRKYVSLLFAVVALALVPKGVVDLWFSYHELKTLLVRIQTEQATLAAEKIGQFVREIEGQMSWLTQLPLATRSNDDWYIDAMRLLRQVPAVTEITLLDASGHERYRMSREAVDVVGSKADFSNDPMLVGVRANKVYYGPVYFVHDSEPYMTIAVAGSRPDDGVIVSRVNLKFIWDVVSQFKVGKQGQAYVVDAQGRLIAHRDISLVLRHQDLSGLAHVQAARGELSQPSNDRPSTATDLSGRSVLSAHAPVASLGWIVFAELPIKEAYAPLYAAMVRSGGLLVVGLGFAFLAGLFLARRMMVPIRALSEGATRIGQGELTQRIAIKTDDELEVLGQQFNVMAGRLQESYATLERKVEERTKQLEVANLAKSRFLATASHDLRQPLHALGLFFAQLRGQIRATERRRILDRIDAALLAMNALFNSLLDISKLDAGVLRPTITDFPISHLLARIESTFGGVAREKGLSLQVIPTKLWTRSDLLLLERVVGNLVSNAVRYTEAGGVLIGCRKQGDQLRVEVWDSGVGIPPDQHQHVFGEFYRVGRTDHGHSGLGLGLAIVERLCRLLHYPINLKSVAGKGSCFSVLIPNVPAHASATKSATPQRRRLDSSGGKLVVVIDDDHLVLEGMGGLLRSWGCDVITATSDDAALSNLMGYENPPDVIISDYHLRGGRTGVDVIAELRTSLSTPVPAFLMSGDTDPGPGQVARANGYVLLHKPVDPMALRAVLTAALRKKQNNVAELATPTASL